MVTPRLYTQKEKMTFQEFRESLDPQQLDQCITNLYLLIVSNEGSCISFPGFDIEEQLGVPTGTLKVMGIDKVKPCDFCPVSDDFKLQHVGGCIHYEGKLSIINEWLYKKKFDLL